MLRLVPLLSPQLDGEQEWTDEVVSQFSQLVKDPGGVKAIVHKSLGGSYFSVTLYVMYVGTAVLGAA